MNFGLRSGVPVLLVNEQNLPYVYFDSTVAIENPFLEFQDIHQQILFPEFQENLMLPGVDSLFESADSLPGDSRSWESPEKADNVWRLFIQILLN